MHSKRWIGKKLPGDKPQPIKYEFMFQDLDFVLLLNNTSTTRMEWNKEIRDCSFLWGAGWECESMDSFSTRHSISEWEKKKKKEVTGQSLCCCFNTIQSKCWWLQESYGKTGGKHQQTMLALVRRRLCSFAIVRCACRTETGLPKKLG